MPYGQATLQYISKRNVASKTQIQSKCRNYCVKSHQHVKICNIWFMYKALLPQTHRQIVLSLGVLPHPLSSSILPSSLFLGLTFSPFFPSPTLTPTPPLITLKILMVTLCFLFMLTLGRGESRWAVSRRLDRSGLCLYVCWTGGARRQA